jgi:hypothetical protein
MYQPTPERIHALKTREGTLTCRHGPRDHPHVESLRLEQKLEEDSMRIIAFSITLSLALLSSVTLAQQSPGTTGDTIGRPPPLPGPPPISEPSPTTQSAPAVSIPQASEPAPKGYTGAYAPAGTPPTPYSTGPLPQVGTGPGLDVAAPDGSTKTVKAVPCGTAARETDGFTTCVGIPDEERRRSKKGR